MPINYLAQFPIPEHLLPPKLLALLKPVELSANLHIEVACREEIAHLGNITEQLNMQMAVVPVVEEGPVKVLSQAGDGVIEFSVPAGESPGCSANFTPSLNGYDYIVASWGSASFYTFNLAEKVWMTLGLTPRCLGNDEQCLIYDDLAIPEFSVAKGQVSSSYYFGLKKKVSWTLSNGHLRKYLWLRASRGVRVFYYRTRLKDLPEIRKLMGGEPHKNLRPAEGVEWYELDIREQEDGLLLQIWASVEAVTPDPCPELTADNVVWPGYTYPMTHAAADALIGNEFVFLDDRFLQKYEENSHYGLDYYQVSGKWVCSPYYQGQWSFTECRRYGRNLISIPMRELYKPKPDREILHARSFAVDPKDIHHEPCEEHIVAKVQRFAEVLLRLGEGLSNLASNAGLTVTTQALIGFDAPELSAKGWSSFPKFRRLAQVVPLNMGQHMFVSRCKSLHEICQRIPDGILRELLSLAGCPRKDLANLKTIKLLQALLNVIQNLNANMEKLDAFVSSSEPEAWSDSNKTMAPLFLNNDLRIADAHEDMKRCLITLEDLGFDTANVNSGYGKAFDFTMDSVIDALDRVATELELFIRNK